MNENEPVEKRRKNPSPPRGGPPRKPSLRRTFAERLRAVKLHLEEGFPVGLVAEEVGVSHAAVSRWVSCYRREGEEGLKDRDRGSSAKRLPAAVRKKILELKQEEPARGVKRISQMLRRIFFLPGSAETVRQTLQEEGLVQSPPKPRRNLTRPRFFERATPAIDRVDKAANSINVADEDYLQSSQTRELSGVYYPVWPQAESFKINFEWDGSLFSISVAVPSTFRSLNWATVFSK